MPTLIALETIQLLDLPDNTVDQWLLSPDGAWLAVTDAAGNIYLYKTSTWSLAKVINTVALNTSAFSSDSRMLASAGFDEGYPINLWDVQSGQLLRKFGRLSNVSLWNVSSKQIMFSLRLGRLSGIALAPDGRTLMSISRDGIVHLWDIPQQP